MDSPIEDTQQQEEITVLQSIYGDDFIDIPPPKAWKVCGLSLIQLNSLNNVYRAPHDFLNLTYAYSTLIRVKWLCC